MTAQRDLVEAQAFGRRRLVGALVRGVPEGPESGPSRPGRVLLGGVALAVLAWAGGAVAGMVLDRPDEGWLDDGSFVVSRGTGQQYVVLHGGSAEDAVLQRVPNLVSAQLVLGRTDPEAHVVAPDHLDDVTLGADLGIPGAPGELPDPEELVGSGWRACTGDGRGTHVSLGPGGGAGTGTGSGDAGPRSDAAFLVRSGRRGPLWLLAHVPGDDRGGPGAGGARRFQLPADPTSAGTLLDRLGVGAPTRVPVVDERWLSLVPVGPPLGAAAFGLEGSGPVRYDDVSPDLSRFEVGDLVQAPDGRAYLLAEAAPQPLAPFPALLYAAVGALPVELDTGLSAAFQQPRHPAQWPQAVPEVVVDGDLCVVLLGDSSRPRVVLSAGPAATAAGDVPRGRRRVTVAPGTGAYARVDGDRGAEGTSYVVTATGTRHALHGPGVADALGYADVAAARVPREWLELFDAGPVLSVEAARRGPS